MKYQLFTVLYLASYSFLLSIVLVSAVHKLKQADKFRHSFIDYGLLPAGLAKRFAGAVGYVEMAAIVGSVMCFSLGNAVLVSLPLVLVYGAYTLMIGFALWTQRPLLDCGCSLSDKVVKVPTRYLLMRNLGLLAVVGANYLLAPTALGSASEWLLGLVISCCLFVLYQSLESLLENSVLIEKVKG